MIINKDKTGLLLFNMQHELVPLLHDSYKLTYDCQWLSELMAVYQIPIISTIHKKLGEPLKNIQQQSSDIAHLEKEHFSITNEPHIVDKMKSSGKSQWILAGGEAHVCILQSAIKLTEMGEKVFILRDTISSRDKNNTQAALERFSYHQIELITQEMLFFELIEQSERDNYLDLSLKFLDGRYIKTLDNRL